ncbi:uncharacterized mitochondrial protein AtMg00810-like [Lathyrus oleraceus]|uniref:uncharacterized mitochondrial protein AtMg00810-like n=1 Tax=Pisum sativum TaxID=3888 RepID=UPI0021D2CD45|nr:uncharacterized mitochondrial protein AtMg00810-like [Pisum sativum]
MTCGILCLDPKKFMSFGKEWVFRYKLNEKEEVVRNKMDVKSAFLNGYIIEEVYAEFEMSLIGELKFFSGIHINKSSKGTYIHQRKYTKELIKKFDMSDCKPAKTPMHPTCILEKDEVSNKVEKKVYIDPREFHLRVVKRIFRYLKGTTNLDLCYTKSKKYKLVRYCDDDYAGDILERKSTSGSCQFLGDNLISWSSKRQSRITLSTTKVEYIAASKCNT